LIPKGFEPLTFRLGGGLKLIARLIKLVRIVLQKRNDTTRDKLKR
jgi:hypothetical protein